MERSEMHGETAAEAQVRGQARNAGEEHEMSKGDGLPAKRAHVCPGKSVDDERGRGIEQGATTVSTSGDSKQANLDATSDSNRQHETSSNGSRSDGDGGGDAATIERHDLDSSKPHIAKERPAPHDLQSNSEVMSGKPVNSAEPTSIHGYPQSKVSHFNIVDCPVFRPTVEEFSNPLKYIAAIRPEAEKFGICIIRPPDVWQPPCALDGETFYFSTRSERTHQLYRRRNATSLFIDALRTHLHKEGVELEPWPMLAQVEVDLYRLYHLVKAFGGAQVITDEDAWGNVAAQLGIPPFASRSSAIFAVYTKYLLSFSMLCDDDRSRLEREVRLNRSHPAHRDPPFGFGTGLQHTLHSFRKMDKAWRKRVFGRGADKKLPPPAEIEKRYWETVKGSDHFNTFYGSDIDTTVHGSAFPKDPNSIYSRFGFNLNVLPGVPESMLKYLDGISGISMPWLYVGMLFSSFCWHVEDNFLYSINYMHFGDGKRWYGVPSSHAHLLEAAFRKHLPDEFRDNPSLLHDLVTMVPPDVLAAEGVLVSTCVQQPRDYVVTFPQAYHAGFSQGLNCCEAVNFASADWLPFGMRAMHQYQLEKRPTTLDQEKLLCQVAMQETDEDMLRYAEPLVRRIISKEKRARQRLSHVPVQPLAEAVRANAEVFDLQETAERTEKHAMKTVDTLATRMRMARGVAKASAEDVRSAALENVCMTCGCCRRICFLSAVLMRQGTSLRLGREKAAATRYEHEDGEGEARSPPRLCCVDCAQQHLTELRDKMEALVVRFDENDLDLVIREIAHKVEHIPPVPAEEFYGL